MAWRPLTVPHALTPLGAPGHSVAFVAGDAAQTTLAITSGQTNTGWAVTAVEWGGARRQVQHSGPRGTLGAQAASSTIDNTTLRITLRLWPAGMDDAAQKLSALSAVADLMARAGGQVTVRRTGASRRFHYQVITGEGVQVAPWTPQSEIDGRTDLVATFTCAPYAVGDGMDVEERWTADTRTDFTFDVGAVGNVQVAGGALTPATPGVAVVMVHSATGYLLAEPRVAASVTPGASLSGWRAGVVIGRSSPTNRWEVVVRDNGTTSSLAVIRVTAGTPLDITSTNLPARVKSGVPLLVFAWISRGMLYGAVRLVGVGGDDWASDTLSAQVASTAIPAGMTGIVLNAPDVAASVNSLDVYGWWSQAQFGGLIDRPCLTIPGDAPAAVGAEFQPTSSAAAWAMVGWMPQLAPGTNTAVGGDLDGVGTVPSVWDGTGASGLTGASTTSIASVGRAGRQSLQIVTAAAANRGAAMRVTIPGGFLPGRVYTSRVWVKSDTQTTGVRGRFGWSTDIASSTPVALTPGWVRHTVAWTPAAWALNAWVAVETTTATATTFMADQVEVFEGTVASPRSFPPGGRPGHQPAGLLTPATAAWTNGSIGPGATTGEFVSNHAASGASTSTVMWDIDPLLATPPDHQSSIDVEVWLSLSTPAGFVGGKVAALTATGSTREFGSAGFAIPASFNGLVRVGTLSIPVGRASQSLTITITATNHGGGTMVVRWVMLTPPSARVVTGPSGKPLDASYPTMLPSLPPGGSPVTRGIDPDGGGWGRATGWWTAAPAVDRTIEMPPGPGRVAVVEALYPPGVTGGAPGSPGHLRLRVWPRYTVAASP